MALRLLFIYRRTRQFQALNISQKLPGQTPRASRQGKTAAHEHGPKDIWPYSFFYSSIQAVEKLLLTHQRKL